MDFISFALSYGIYGIALTIFLAYTILPLPSEPIIITGFATLGFYKVLIVATITSILGSFFSYYIGRWGVKYFIDRESKWFKKAERTYNKYADLGIIVLNNFPLLGDPIIIISGIANFNIYKFSAYIIITRIIYFIAIAYLGVGFEALFTI